MMLRLIDFHVDTNTITGVILVNRDSISAAQRLCRNMLVHDYKDNGERILGTGRQQDVEYTEITLNNGIRFQVFNDLDSIYEMVNT